MSVFIVIPIVTQPKPFQDADGQVVTPEPQEVNLRVRPEYVVAVNDLLEGPNDKARSMVYFDADSGMRQEFSTLSASEIDNRVSDKLAEL